jgi:hypothetical protein
MAAGRRMRVQLLRCDLAPPGDDRQPSQMRDRNHRLSVTAVLLLLAHLCACGSSDPPPRNPPFVVSGLVEFVNVEGGCFVFHGVDGDDYHLIARPEVALQDVLENGAFLAVELRLRPDLAGFCPGKIAEVLRILSAALPLRGDLWLLRADEGGATRWSFVEGSGR